MQASSIAPLFLPDRDVAAMLGRDVAWLRKNAERLEVTTGFPKVDPAVGYRHREAIEAWARDRNIKAAAGRRGRLTDTNQEDYDEF